MMLGRKNRCVRYQSANACNLLCIFNGRKYASMTRLCALRKLKFDHFYFLAQSLFAKHIRAEISALVAAAEIARTDLPNQITTLHMIVRYTTFPRIVIKLAPCRSLVQRHDGVDRKSTR